ncbi:hypothetical protein BATDEDRAFT_24655 [Batrachochytrium dendrobatidis JAM81]|uniref:DNA-directed DNA polymerase n=1 Tax=Batrachochytrium dendrobatidis (strain JAM81 / FGSC 10211) TaxID=684364 RepID=F4P206_BATDJ|nr:uncharacterized protein BATDEDRAFT_24655 [Batrachochytrium dendrobatidis JAM81]EGF80776.1 hypothetical protein BATDEDRAFT_24655 [Batrachochytrium dendrobatidis JAM81]|eukprot:XP_006678509.1 hypothetical protein BATDEDRAFT_24655 [Batrachochytrium dendrobatidis JAM81]
MQFYPSGNTSLFNVNERPLVNNSVDDILEQLEGDDIVERLKRPNSNKSIVSFESVASNMCFWFCLARHKYQDVRLDRLSTKSKELYRDYYKVKPDKSYPGVDIQELDSIEDHFSNLHHFSYSINLSQLTKVFQYPECHSFFNEFKKIKPHLNICKKPKIVFEDGNYQPKPNVFENLEQNGIIVPRELRFYPYFIYFDFETWLKPVESTTNSKLKYIGTHELLSISLIGSEELQAEFIPVESTPKYLPQVLMKYNKKHGNVSKSEKLWIRSIEEELGRNIEQSKRIGRYNADGYDGETNTVYEFNGCFFHGCRKCYHPDDVNPLTGDKMNVLYEKTMRKEAKLKQMGYDVKSVWGCEFRMPTNEEVTQNLTKYADEHPELKQYSGNVIQLLKHSPIPSKKWFYNGLKDVKPGVEATKKLCNFFQSLNLDMHKDGISIPGLTLKYLWNTKANECEFQLFKGNEELYQKYRDNLVGGPSIVFHHYHERNKTRIRGGRLCQKILGYDANALYLWALSQDMPCGEHKMIEPYPDILEDVMNGSFFGEIECDIAVPEHVKEYFAEMPPIFKNTEIQYKDLNSDTKAQVKPNYKSKKLIGSMFGNKIMFPTKLLKWYLEHGLMVSNITYAVKYERKAPFKSFAQQVSNERRAGDTSPDYKLRGEMMKLMGKSSYGKCITDFLKHETVKIVGRL